MEGPSDRRGIDVDLDWDRPQEALRRLAKTTDECLRDGDVEGLRASLEEIDAAPKDEIAPRHRGRLFYFQGNVWDALGHHTSSEEETRDEEDGQGEKLGVEWDRKERRENILALRTAINEGIEAEDTPTWLSQAYTNLGNALTVVGRTVEAIRRWDQALNCDPDQSMAHANRGLGYRTYARLTYDRNHARALHTAAFADIELALQNPRRLEPRARQNLPGILKSYQRAFGVDTAAGLLDPPDASLGDSETERQYRAWCLENTLFLHPLNDVGLYAAAAHDPIGLPAITSADFQPEEWIALFNQIKQTYADARFLLFDGLQSEEPHFADRGVFTPNPGDYPVYGLASEKVRAAYRTSYSLLDKVAFFVNDYLELGIPDTRMKFSTFWFKAQDPNQPLRDEFQRNPNPALRGLYWVSLDLHERDGGFRDATLPEARELAEIRHSLEHRFLRLRDSLGEAVMEARPYEEPERRRSLGYKLTWETFTERALTMLRQARAAILYLVFAVHWEERPSHSPNEDGGGRPDEGRPLEMAMDVYEHDWKRPPP